MNRTSGWIRHVQVESFSWLYETLNKMTVLTKLEDWQMQWIALARIRRPWNVTNFSRIILSILFLDVFCSVSSTLFVWLSSIAGIASFESRILPFSLVYCWTKSFQQLFCGPIFLLQAILQHEWSLKTIMSTEKSTCPLVLFWQFLYNKLLN